MMKKTMKKPGMEAGQFAYEGLDRALHEKARLGIMTSLATRPQGLLFGELKELCALTDGNLSRHLQTLEQAGMIEMFKGFQGRRPQTLVRLTAEGRGKFFAYLEELERVIEAGVAAKRVKKPGAGEMEIPDGWAPA